MKLKVFLNSGQIEEIEIKLEDKDKIIQLISNWAIEAKAAITNGIKEIENSYIIVIDKDDLPCPFSKVVGLRLIL